VVEECEMGEFVKVAEVGEIHSGHGKLIKTAASEVIFNAAPSRIVVFFAGDPLGRDFKGHGSCPSS
jgi:hypothetical protein